MAELVDHAERTGVVFLGGGTPKNYIQQAEVALEYITGNDRGHDFGIQITTDAPHWGGLSGCTFRESESLGKVSSRLHDRHSLYRRHHRASPIGHCARPKTTVSDHYHYVCTSTEPTVSPDSRSYGTHDLLWPRHAPWPTGDTSIAGSGAEWDEECGDDYLTHLEYDPPVSCPDLERSLLNIEETAQALFASHETVPALPRRRTQHHPADHPRYGSGPRRRGANWSTVL